MLALVQRVSAARVCIDNTAVASINAGLLVLVCAEPTDTPETANTLVHKLLKLRIFDDAQGKMNLSLQETAGGLLLVSQFTLAADTSRGNRPSFMRAAPPELGRFLFTYLVETAKMLHHTVGAGRFGADMHVTSTNNGPVTIPLHIQ